MPNTMGSLESLLAPPRSQNSDPSPKSVPQNQDHLVALNFRVPFKLRQNMKVAATLRGMTMTELLITALQNYLSK